ncbi:MAG: hypothetical protein AB2807_07675, partial [Candidatus Sedimenticola endophacoides]
AGEEAVSLLAAGHFFHWIKLCTYELNSGGKVRHHSDIGEGQMKNNKWIIGAAGLQVALLAGVVIFLKSIDFNR